MRVPVRKVIPVILLALIGLATSIATESVHRSLVTNIDYTSFCHVSATVDCDRVLSSQYAVLAGVSVSLLGAFYHLVLLGLTVAVLATPGARRRGQLCTALLLMSVWGFGFSVYMAVMAFAVLHTVCLMCSGLYLVAIALLVSTWRLRRAVAPVGRRQVGVGQDRRVILAGFGAVAVLVIAVAWEVSGGGPQLTTVAEIREHDREFFDWYKSQPMAQISAEDGNSRGSKDASVTIIEFSDFGCGHCNAFHQSVEEVWRRERKDLRIVFRHFPLDSACNPALQAHVHPQACLASIAAECAGEQGKFWEYHNLLFDNQQQLEREFLLTFAARLGLDGPTFSACLGSAVARSRVERDAKLGAQLGIDSTPTVYINGRAIKGALDATRLAKALVLARDEHATPSTN